MTNMQPIAHAAKDKNCVWREPHGLADHLRAVASLASQNARRFNGSDWAHLAGLWHDLGKYRPRFQHYIRQASDFEVDAHIKAKIETRRNASRIGNARGADWNHCPLR